jgi:hypothetical protein
MAQHTENLGEEISEQSPVLRSVLGSSWPPIFFTAGHVSALCHRLSPKSPPLSFMIFCRCGPCYLFLVCTEMYWPPHLCPHILRP